MIFVCLDPPAAPSLLEVSSFTEDSVTLTWLSPERDGGARITRYVVEKRMVNSYRWERAGEVDPSDILVITLWNLIEGRPYMFRVYAENDAGVGLAIETKEPVTPRAQSGKSEFPELCDN